MWKKTWCARVLFKTGDEITELMTCVDAYSIIEAAQKAKTKAEDRIWGDNSLPLYGKRSEFCIIAVWMLEENETADYRWTKE